MTDTLRDQACNRAMAALIEAFERGDAVRERAEARRFYALRHCEAPTYLYTITLTDAQERRFERWFAADEWSKVRAAKRR